MVAHTCNPTLGGIQSQLCREFKASLGYIRHYLKQNKKQKQASKQRKFQA